MTSYLKQHSANTSATVPKQRLTAIHLFQVNVSLFLSQGQQSTARTFKCHTRELRAAAQMTSLCSYSSFLLGVEHSNTLRDSVPTLCRVPFRFLTRATGTKILFNTLFIALNLSFFFFFWWRLIHRPRRIYRLVSTGSWFVFLWGWDCKVVCVH